MPDSRGWPDPAKPGVPMNLDEEGPHRVVDFGGVHRWACWSGRKGRWRVDGQDVAPSGVAGWTYLGPAIPPEGPMPPKQG